MKKIKNVFVIVLLLVITVLMSSCQLLMGEEVNNTSNNGTSLVNTRKYGISLNEVNDDIDVSSLDQASIVANIAMSATVEVSCQISYTYSYTSYGFFGGGSSRTMSGSSSSLATAFFINEDGYLVTNAHVVTLENESTYKDLKYTKRDIVINYADSDELFSVSLVACDTDLDLAILKLDDNQGLDDVKYVTFFNLTDQESDEYYSEDAIKIFYGEYCVAIGNALGYGISVTSGIVSAPYRKFNENGVTVKAIQTDAAINEGNSGGPLCNKYGCVIGINSFKTVTNTSELLGFAIPSNIVMQYIETVNANEGLSIKYYMTDLRAYVN